MKPAILVARVFMDASSGVVVVGGATMAVADHEGDRTRDESDHRHDDPCGPREPSEDDARDDVADQPNGQQHCQGGTLLQAALGEAGPHVAVVVEDDVFEVVEAVVVVVEHVGVTVDDRRDTGQDGHQVGVGRFARRRCRRDETSCALPGRCARGCGSGDRCRCGVGKQGVALHRQGEVALSSRLGSCSVSLVLGVQVRGRDGAGHGVSPWLSGPDGPQLCEWRASGQICCPEY